MIVGALLLMLPISKQAGVNLSFIDSLFMSCSAICVTGLSVVADLTTTFTPFGLVIMVILMELGGLGIITFTVFFAIIIGAKIGITERFELKEVLNQTNSNGMVRLVKVIVATSFSIQFIMGMIYFIILGCSGMYSLGQSFFIGMFHSVSSFNNAGFDIFGGGTSMLAFADNVAMNVSTITSIILGGLGFIVIYDLAQKLIHGKKHRISYHSKVVIVMSFLISLIGTLLFKICMGNGMTWLEALFQCVTARTAGFESFDMNNLSMSAYCVMIALMFIGANPCSTGGGIKTTTLFIICVALFNFARGKEVVVFNRKIDNQSVFKACALFAISIIYVCVALFLFVMFESGLGFQECLFEVVSAFGTVGLSMGITPTLHIGSKVILMITMIVGRLGPLTIINVLNNNWNKSSEAVGYVEEKMIIG